MMLFRGFREKPIIMNPQLHEEYQRLNDYKRKTGDTINIAERARTLGEQRFTRWFTLRQARGSQFFTDDEAMARGFAGDEGYIVRIEVPQDVVTEHYRGDQTMTAGREKARLVSNFVFSGDEVSNLFKTDAALLIDIQTERHEGQPPVV